MQIKVKATDTRMHKITVPPYMDGNGRMANEKTVPVVMAELIIVEDAKHGQGIAVILDAWDGPIDLREFLSTRHLSAIKEKKAKDGDRVLVECLADYSNIPEDMGSLWRAYIDYYIKMSSIGTMSLYKLPEEKLYTEDDLTLAEMAACLVLLSRLSNAAGPMKILDEGKWIEVDTYRTSLRTRYNLLKGTTTITDKYAF